MRKYPKFLKSLPEFYGLGFPDLCVLMAMLYFSMLFNFRPFASISLSALAILTFKFVRKNFDLIGWMLPMKKDIFLSDAWEVKNDSTISR
ncbi:MAG: hypothetical protein HYV97_05930 [Bdellovibrio sp.]|nr:hypothetical protein [Bdellovibrio sp.]